MNKYTKLSDFEINKSVAEKLGLTHVCNMGTVIIYDFLGCSSFDPCNNPSDAMTIIIENKINLKHLANNSNNLMLANHGEHWCIRKNPYRASMEVFLMMKDKENNND